uniref:E3 ubiquitin-protein ligase parkin n=1 Tax=Amphiprion ocellaris TaxID=80972 RepID=A0AAQ5Y031_AMPOC
MIVFVRYNLGPGVAVELQEESSVAELKELVGSQQGVRPEQLRVLFAGTELQNSSTLQSCDLPEQSTVHVVLPPAGSSSQLQQNHLTRPDLGSSHLPPSSPSSPGLAEVLEGRQEAAGVRTCSTFYVYCKSCRSVQPGKLRVRCQSCRQTTMMLSRYQYCSSSTICSILTFCLQGPSCWDDVLLQGRIHGICQSEGCHGNETEFYMKCATHPTPDDDLSVALDLIMTNTRDVPCIACTDVMDVVVVFPCLERHVICLDCFRGYCEARLSERRFVHHPVIGYSLPCAAGCEDSLIREVHHFRVLGDEQYGRYQRYGAEECLLAIGGLMCPSPGCGAGLLPPDGSRRVECDRPLGCGFIFCRDCREGYHQGPCQDFLSAPQGFLVGGEAALRGRWDRESLLLIQETTKRCPQCSVPVERNGGCMHMACPRCQTEWCWLCGVPWNRDCMGNHWFG